MDAFRQLLRFGEPSIARLIREKAERLGFLAESAMAEDVLLASVSKLSRAMEQTLETEGIDGCAPSPVPANADDILAEVATDLARHHRRNGVGLALFMGMFKLYRQACAELVRQKADDENGGSDEAFINRFFDQVEIALCVDWAQAEKEGKLAALSVGHEAAVEERNRFLALVNSLTSPVFLLDPDMRIVLMNHAAPKLFGNNGSPTRLEYALLGSDEETAAEERLPLGETLPWLAEAMGEFCSLDSPGQGCRFEVSTAIDDRQHHFNVAASSVSGFSKQLTGTTLYVDDVTERVLAGRQLVHERNMAATYLDLVGSIVVAMDPSGGILLLNKTGCEILGYEKMEIVGRNWIDLVIPPEERYELQEYFHEISTGNMELDDEHVNYVTTKSGELRLVLWKNRLLTNDEGHTIGILASGTDITSQREMEDALAEKELWLRNTFVALGEAVLILAPDNQVIDANPAAETMFRMTNDEICDINVEQLHVDRARFVECDEMLQRAFAEGETTSFEFTMRRSTGEVFPTEHSVSIITHDDGSILGTVYAIRDISARKRAELVLRQSEEKFRRIFETIQEGFIVTDMDGVVQMVNPATCQLLGYDDCDLVGKDMGVLYSSNEERVRLRHALNTKGAVRGIHLTAARKDGSTLTVEANAHVVLAEDGAPIGMEGTFHDITARLEAEKVLREREKQYRAFFENNHAIMLLEDPQTGEIIDANPAASDFYGYSVDEMRSMRVDQISAMTEEDVFKEMAQARSDGRAYFIFRHKLADGETRDVEVYSGPILVRGNQLLYSVIHDVTARIRLEREMKRMATTDALTGASNRHQFFELAVHELRRAQRYEHPMAALMLDIDYFKSINDTYGHQTGDIVLKALTALAKATLRESDIFGRLGGEEFAAILPETPIMNAIHVADRLREELSKLTIRDQDTDINFTVSIGVTVATKQDKIIEDVLARADEALYKAKRTGRNKVEKG